MVPSGHLGYLVATVHKSVTIATIFTVTLYTILLFLPIAITYVLTIIANAKKKKCARHFSTLFIIIDCIIDK